MSILKAINLQHPTASTANITLSNTGGISLNGSVSGGGMDLITPTSVAGTGVTLSGGSINISAATNVSINGCFTSVYQHYLITGEYVPSSAGTLASRLRAAGSDATGNNYLDQGIYANGGTISGVRNATTSWSNLLMNITPPCSFTMYLFSPLLATATNLLSHSQYSASNAALLVSAGNHSLSTAYDGISFLPSAGNISGIFRIYGLRNS